LRLPRVTTPVFLLGREIRLLSDAGGELRSADDERSRSPSVTAIMPSRYRRRDKLRVNTTETFAPRSHPEVHDVPAGTTDGGNPGTLSWLITANTAWP
jgi:hypothetical protein